MVPPNASPWESRVWRDELARAYRKPEELLSALDLPCEPELDASIERGFSTLVPRTFAAKMRPGVRADPLLRQVLPDVAERADKQGFTTDPLAEQAATVTGNLVQKYDGRALLITTPGCAVHCRYCFRRHFPYDEHRPGTLDLAMAAIEADVSLSEVILSGGDPLLLPDDALTKIIRRLDSFPHLRRLRIHTRLPIVLPQRITAQLLDLLGSCRADIVVVVHSNHAQELDDVTQRAFAALRQTGLWLLNQSVLLRGVNDTIEAQVDLQSATFAQGVLPYYLHLPDPIAGTHHFFVDEQAGQALHREMQAKLPGYLVPRLVKEIAGEPNKLIVSSKD
ncbi:MAG: EF-P beta-lysylation protein EpmB [Pseudomonadales bacterium]|nr:EF-P beta-lysylation protein EpmB [Pseudomonadales bacterium]